MLWYIVKPNPVILLLFIAPEGHNKHPASEPSSEPKSEPTSESGKQEQLI